MKPVLFIVLITCQLNAMAQTGSTWKLCFNGKEILKGNVEQDEPKVILEAAAISKGPGKNLTIYFNQPGASKDWKRTFYLNNEDDHVLHTIIMNNQSGKISFPASYLAKSASQKNPVFIYTTSLPKDENKAAAIRVRRLLLGKIEWK